MSMLGTQQGMPPPPPVQLPPPPSAADQAQAAAAAAALPQLERERKIGPGESSMLFRVPEKGSDQPMDEIGPAAPAAATPKDMSPTAALGVRG